MTWHGGMPSSRGRESKKLPCAGMQAIALPSGLHTGWMKEPGRQLLRSSLPGSFWCLLAVVSALNEEWAAVTGTASHWVLIVSIQINHGPSAAMTLTT